jgi:transposase-like protein
MGRPKKYPDELIARGVRLALESGRPIAQIAADLGMSAETLRERARQAKAARAPGSLLTLLLDETYPRAIAEDLHSRGHDAVSVHDAPGAGSADEACSTMHDPSIGRW